MKKKKFNYIHNEKWDWKGYYVSEIEKMGRQVLGKYLKEKFI